MNKKNVQIAINIMKKAQNLDMTEYQRGDESCFANSKVETIDELHKCGNRACFAGYIAISDDFQASGGKVCNVAGHPFYDEFKDLHRSECAVRTVAKWLGISDTLAKKLILQYGAVGEFYPVLFRQVKPYHVIEKLKLILSGDLS